MQLTAKIKDVDELYYNSLIKDILNLKDDTNTTGQYIINNKVLESILMKAQVNGILKFQTSNSTPSIDFLVSTYKQNGVNMSVDELGRFKIPDYDMPMIELTPINVEIKPQEFPKEATVYRRNHGFIMFKLPDGFGYTPDKIICLNYKGPKAIEEANSKPVEKIKINTAA